MSCLISLASTPATLASDHVDSPSVTVAGPTYRAVATESTTDSTSAQPTVASGKPEDITDIYFFREIDQNPNAASDRVAMVMTLNGLTKPGHSNYFAPDVAYQMKISTDKNNLESSANVFTFRFGAPDSNGQQKIYLNGVDTNSKTTAYAGTNTNADEGLADPAITANYHNTSKNTDNNIKVFAGEADDPFFLDFRVINEGLVTGVGNANPVSQIAAVGTPGQMGYVPAHNIDNLSPNAKIRKPGDSFGFSNVNAIVISMPISALQTMGNTEQVFYAWGTTYK